ncbi:MAG: dTMP kinase [candidate division Zixibacteria bacterium]|nr:dTMP kinase [candidate division Zixibacteria bacterium]
MKGRLITFEGIDGCGKTTHSKKLKDYLLKKGYKVLLLREPGGEKIAEKIRRILLSDKNKKIAPLAELFLYNASRAQLVETVVLPALKDGKMVICDRFYDSTLAYQGYGRGLNKGVIKCLNQIAANGIIPNLTILIDLPPLVALKRKGKTGVIKDRLEQENLDFHKKVRNGYLKIASINKRRFRIVDAKRNINDTWSGVKKAMDDFLKKRNQNVR